MREVLKKIAHQYGLIPYIHAYRRFGRKIVLSIFLFFRLDLDAVSDFICARKEAKKIREKNNLFIKMNPSCPIPPLELAYDAYAHVDWEIYFQGGKEQATYVAQLILKHAREKNELNILDWGCGPARVVRHLSSPLLPKITHLYASDYNPSTVAWCQKQFQTINFSLNNLKPPLKYDKEFFDAIYSISVLTHLSEDSHYLWIKEICRVLKPRGLFIVTTQGDRYRKIFSKNELDEYNKGQLVFRSEFREGKRDFGTFHPPKFLMEKLFVDFDILEHQTTLNFASMDFRQDFWVLRKRE